MSNIIFDNNSGQYYEYDGNANIKDFLKTNPEPVNIIPVYPVFLHQRLGCFIPPNYSEDCEYYNIDHDMGASNPYCLKRHTTYPDNCSEKCPYYRNKYEQLISRTETEPYKYED